MATYTYGAMSTYLANKLMDHILRNTSYNAPGPNLWLGLYTTNPGDDDTGSEVSGGDYARASASASGSSLPFVISGSCAYNYYDIEFPTPSSSWGDVGYFGILDEETSGNLLFYGKFSASRTINIGEAPKIVAQSLYVFSASTPIAGSLVNHVLNGINYSSPGSAVYAGLLHRESSVLSEFSGSGYERIAIGGTSFWDSPVSGSSFNSGSLVFCFESSGSWGVTITTLRLYDASSGGNAMFSCELNTPKLIYEGDGFYIPEKGMKIQLDTHPFVN
jgi:hypothetical protein